MNWTQEDLDKVTKDGRIRVVPDKNAPATQKSQKSPSWGSRDVALAHVRQHGSGPEVSFAESYLEDRVKLGDSLGWAHEPLEIRMVGQTYTPDFLEVGCDGVLRFYEVKGAKKIPSQDRSSAKYRTTAALFESDRVQFFWAKQRKDGGFSPKKLPKQGKRDTHRFLRQK